MSIGTVVAVKVGKTNPLNVYIKLKNSAVYKMSMTSPNGVEQLRARIKELQNKVPLKMWKKVK